VRVLSKWMATQRLWQKQGKLVQELTHRQIGDQVDMTPNAVTWRLLTIRRRAGHDVPIRVPR
jgi:hypothetical protein